MKASQGASIAAGSAGGGHDRAHAALAQERDADHGRAPARTRASVSLVSSAAPVSAPAATSQRSERSESARQSASESAAPSASSSAAFEKVAARTTTPGQRKKVSARLKPASGASGTTRRASSQVSEHRHTEQHDAQRAQRAQLALVVARAPRTTGVATRYASGGWKPS